MKNKIIWSGSKFLRPIIKLNDPNQYAIIKCQKKSANESKSPLKMDKYHQLSRKNENTFDDQVHRLFITYKCQLVTLTDLLPETNIPYHKISSC